MPELPAVETYKNYLKVTALHKKITAVKINNTKILKHLSIQTFKDQLKDRSFEALKRHGKLLFIQLDNSEWIRLITRRTVVQIRFPQPFIHLL